MASQVFLWQTRPITGQDALPRRWDARRENAGPAPGSCVPWEGQPTGPLQQQATDAKGPGRGTQGCLGVVASEYKEQVKITGKGK